MSPSYIPYGRQSISEDDIDAVNEVLRSSFLTQGTKVPSFETAVALKVGSKYAVAVNSATSALHLACLSLGLGVGDILWTSPISFVASANCARYCDASVDFIDIDHESGLLSIVKLREKLDHAQKVNQLPKILVAVHLAGNSCEMAEIKRLSLLYNFRIIEDASHAIGGMYKNEYIGSCKYSDITVFSFHPVKIITTGEGGMLTTNCSKLANHIYLLRSHGIERDQDKFINESVGSWGYEQQYLGFNYRMTDIQAALGISQLKKLDHFVHQRNTLLANYRDFLADLPVKLLTIPSENYSAVHLAVIRILKCDIFKHRKIFEKMRELGIGVQVHYTPIHLQPYYRKRGFSENCFPNSEQYANSCLSLPIYPELSSNDQQRVVSSLNLCLQNQQIY